MFNIFFCRNKTNSWNKTNNFYTKSYKFENLQELLSIVHCIVSSYFFFISIWLQQFQILRWWRPSKVKFILFDYIKTKCLRCTFTVKTCGAQFLGVRFKFTWSWKRAKSIHRNIFPFRRQKVVWKVKKLLMVTWQSLLNFWKKVNK